MQLDLAQVKQMEINDIQSSQLAREEFARITGRMAANYQQVIDQTQQFMETFTAMKPQLTAFQPGLVQKIESQSTKIKSTVGEATETTLSSQTKHKLQFLYEESYRVHRQLSKLRSY